jgi:hypothetical protein
MPYIDKDIRSRLDKNILELKDNIISASTPDTIEGNLNYVISNLLDTITLGDKWRYRHINRGIGVTECLKLELYRRLAGPYEDTAINKNGDIETYTSFFDKNNQ